MSNARKLADNLPKEGQLGNRNLIINGAQNVHQRGNQTGKTASVYGTDRFEAVISGRSELVYNLAQNTDVPSGYGFSNSLSFQTTTPESSITAAEYYFISQKIEAQNLQHLAYGTSGAKKLTASFWVKSSVTGTFCLGLFKDDSAGSLEYQVHNKTYTISAANTWEHKTITFEANTLTGGGIADDNGIGLYLTWHLAVGSNYDTVSTSSGWANYSTTNWCEPNTTDAVITTTNATFLLTGVQLEVGSQATPFEHKSYGDELERCQRYLYRWTPITGNYNFYSTGYVYTTTRANIVAQLPVEMRAAATLTSGGNFRLCAVVCTNVSSLVLSRGNPKSPSIEAHVASGLTTGQAIGLGDNNDATAFIQLDAEL